MCNYPTGSTAIPKMKFRSKIQTTCSEKICPKKRSLRYQEKINTHYLQLHALGGKKSQASVHRLLFFNSSGLKAVAHIPNIIGKEESRNLSITPQRGLSGSGYFSFVAFSSQQLPTYSQSIRRYLRCPSEYSSTFFPLLVLELNLFVKCSFGSRTGWGNREECVHFIMILAHLPAFCQPANIYIRSAGLLHLLGFFCN